MPDWTGIHVTYVSPIPNPRRAALETDLRSSVHCEVTAVTGITHLIDDRPRVAKYVVDGVAVLLATPLAFAVAGSARPTWAALLIATASLALLKLALYGAMHMRERSWATVTFRDMRALVQLVVLSAVLGTLALGIISSTSPALWVPWNVGVIDAFITLCLMGGARAAVRHEHERIAGGVVDPDALEPVLVVGAGQAGALAVRELLRHPEMGLAPRILLDDDPAKRGMRISDVPVVGVLADAPRAIEEHHIGQVLIAIPSDRTGATRRVVDLVKSAHPEIPCKIIPGVYEVLSGKVDVSRIRYVDIDDLLGRPPVRLDVDTILSYLKGKRVLVTGAGGSIGSELVRQICRFEPAELILFGHGENSIYSLERELDRDWPRIRYHGVIGAIQNRDRLDSVFVNYRPEVVFHAAAHKHVPLMEQNPEEAVFNNIVGSRNLVDMALKHNVSHFVSISTDKAVNPTSIMGASKRMVEHLVKDAARRAAPDQVFVAVRFGNVLGSRGSVIPIFKSQIQAGGPVTVTHPDMVRYFMTIPEAAQLVLQASGMGHNNEVFLLDMGEQVRIVDLARDLIRLSGLQPDIDIKIEYTGVRPGERLSETLLTDFEQTIATTHEKIVIAKTDGADHEALHNTIDRLQQAAMVSDHAAIRSILQAFLEGANLTKAAAPRREALTGTEVVRPAAVPARWVGSSPADAV